MLTRARRQQLKTSDIGSPSANIQVIKQVADKEPNRAREEMPQRGRRKVKLNDERSKPKSKGKTKIGHRKHTYAIEEDIDSSDSDYLRRRRLFDEDEEEVKFEYIEDQSDGEELGLGMGADMNFDYEDNLNNEIERILIDIYNSHISANVKKKKLNVEKYEKHIKFFSQTLNEQYNIFILQILSEKIKELIKRYKEKILEIPEINKIYQHYVKIKKSIPERRLNTLRNIQILKTKIDTDTKKHQHELSDARILLVELRNVKRSLIKSSSDIERVFHYPLLHLKNKGDLGTFSIEEIHKEEFTSTLVEDEFISLLISQVKIISQQLNVEEFNQLILEIEDTGSQEMTRFTNFLNHQLKFYFEAEDRKFQDGVSDNHSDEISEAKSITLDHKGNSKGSATAPEEITSASSNASAKKNNKKLSEIDLDELVKFIVTEEAKPEKVTKKRNRKKKPKDETNFDHDPEVEMFKQSILDGAVKAHTERKIKPVITQEWLNDICKLVAINK